MSLTALAAACGPKPLAAPPAAPRVASAVDFIPPDLDVLARLDMARMKAALGAITPELLSRDVLARGSGSPGEEPDELIVPSLLEAEVVYLAYRPSASFLPLDRVLALQGRFAPITRAPEGFAGVTDLGADIRHWDRRGAKPARASTARLYALGERVRVFVSEAELDAVERTLAGLSSRPLVAPEEGALSLAVRPRALAKLVGGSLRGLLEDSRDLQLIVDLESDMATLLLSLSTASPEAATALASAGKQVLARLLGERAQGAELRVTAEHLSLSLRLRREELAPAFACLRASGSAAECPW